MQESHIFCLFFDQNKFGINYVRRIRMERWWLTLILIIFSQNCFSSIQNQELIFKNCTRLSLNNNTPQERDRERLNCIEKKWPITFGFSHCLQESRKFEYLMNEELSLKSCYFTKLRHSNIKNCLTVANLLHSVSDRDDMRVNCALANNAYKNKLTCDKVAKSLEQSQIIKKFNQICYEN